MKNRLRFTLIGLIAAAGAVEAAAQAPTDPTIACMRPVPAPVQAAGLQASIVAREVSIPGIAGVVAPGSQWRKIWQSPGNSADGILPTLDGGVLIAQMDFDTVLKIGASSDTSVAVPNAKGIGSLSFDREGRLYGAHRTERPGSTKPDRDSIVNAITQLAPERRLITDKWSDGTTLSARPNDLIADGAGGAFFTSGTGCLFYADPNGARVLAPNLRTNGIILSPDDRTLYVTNGGSVVAFDVVGKGAVTNGREFARLAAGGNGDGLAVDSEGRLYVTSQPGVQVFDRTGQYLGLIPMPRPGVALTFAGPGKQTLYVIGSGAEDEQGRPIRAGPQQMAATIYTLPMIARGISERPK